jgi:hypothetical protein
MAEVYHGLSDRDLHRLMALRLGSAGLGKV